MRNVSFLDLTVTVREQIYAELLVCPAAYKGQYLFRPDHVSTGILYTNRQIYTESSHIFYSKNLFIAVESDYDIFRGLSVKPPTWIRFLACRTVDKISKSASHGRFALSMDLLSLLEAGRRFPQELAIGRAAFVITAQALRYIMDDLVAALGRPTGVSIFTFQIYNTFRYSALRFAELVFEPVLAMQRLPAFKALGIRGPLHPDYHQRLMSKLLHHQDRIWYDFAGMFASHRSRIQHNMLPHQVDTDVEMQWNLADLRSLLRALDIVWDFHASVGFKHNEHYAQASLFQSVADLYGMLVLAHLIEAKRHPDQALSSYLIARQVAEEGIAYLTRDDRKVDQGTFETFPSTIKEENMTLTGRAKAMLSLKASKVCIKLGDKTTASHYITDAHRQDANMSPSSFELHLKLRWKNLPELNELSDECMGRPVLWNTQRRVGS
jgi:hypothetical protein